MRKKKPRFELLLTKDYTTSSSCTIQSTKISGSDRSTLLEGREEKVAELSPGNVFYDKRMVE